MNETAFYKYQGTGNDFVMIDNRQKQFNVSDISLIAKLCDRRFGIGADGVILIEESDQYDFEMVYFNPDGSQSLCGNGSRCAVMFAKALGMIKDETEFLAIDGIHKAFIKESVVHLQLHDVLGFETIGNDFLIDTGSPHYIKYVNEVTSLDVVKEGRAIRYSDRFTQAGVNVNFIKEEGQNVLSIRTYERGVENETLSCGTGCTAAAISLGLKGGKSPVTLNTQGGALSVAFKKDGNTFTDVYLAGPARKVFEGQIEL
ncbi:MAG: diaminopimelate epimerase [Candidatus Endobugula sp.]|jgi:diaminopimelate epimerase